jgi:hypothetical protein
MNRLLRITLLTLLLPIAASPQEAVVAIGENSDRTGEVGGEARFATEGVITCRVGLFLSRPCAGKRYYHFAHSPEMPTDTLAFHGFLRDLGGGPFTALIFAPAKTVEAQSQRLRDHLGRLGARLEFVPYGDTEVYEGFTFLATLSGRTLAVQATDGRQNVLKVFSLDE